MRKLRETVKRLGTTPPNLGSILDVKARKREEVALLLRCIWRTKGLETDVWYSNGRLAISCRGISPDFEPDDPAGLLGLVMAIAHLLDGEHDEAPDFVIHVDFWAMGSMITTVGKAMNLSARLQEERMTPDEFREVFDFRLGRMPA